MKKLLIIAIIFSLFSCKKEAATTGEYCWECKWRGEAEYTPVGCNMTANDFRSYWKDVLGNDFKECHRQP